MHVWDASDHGRREGARNEARLGRVASCDEVEAHVDSVLWMFGRGGVRRLVCGLGCFRRGRLVWVPDERVDAREKPVEKQRGDQNRDPEQAQIVGDELALHKVAEGVVGAGEVTTSVVAPRHPAGGEEAPADKPKTAFKLVTSIHDQHIDSPF